MTSDRPLAPSPHPLAVLRRHTAARIGLGRAGAGLPTTAHLDFAEAHARARDAVHAPFDVPGLEARLRAGGREALHVASQTSDRATYLRRPDLGRRLSDTSHATLQAAGGSFDLAIVLADGLSAYAANAYAAPLALEILRSLPADRRVAPVVIASQARVALSDPVGEALGARLVLMLIGERPGLSAADGLGAYLTHSPRTGRTDADRNCVSNIRDGGLPPTLAAAKLVGLLERSRALGFSGTRLKDDDGAVLREGQDMPSIEANSAAAAIDSTMAE